MLQILKDLKSLSDAEVQKEEYRKKYENYKKLCLQEKLEKDQKTMELKILKESDPQSTEIKELRVKYENLKLI